MKLVITRRIGEQPLVIEAQQVVAYDRLDNPILIGSTYCRDQFFVSHAGEDTFNATLRALGIDRVVICEPMRQQDSAPPAGAVLIGGPNVSHKR